MEQPTSAPSSTSPSSSLWGPSWRGRFPLIVIAIVAVAIVAGVLISRGILKTPFLPQPKQGLTDEQKIQMLKDLGGAPAPQPSDQQKLQTLQQLSGSQKNTSQPSDADKLKALQQVQGK